MATHISTSNPARSDVVSSTPAADTTRDTTRDTTPDTGSGRWALAGLGAALTAIAGGVCAMGVDSVHQEGPDAGAVAAALQDEVPLMIGFQVLQSVAAVLLVVFALGLHRRLRPALPATSLAPALAAAGLLGTAVVMVMSTALNTEFIFGVAEPDTLVPEAAVVYTDWVATVPGLWVLGGLTGVALFAAARAGAVSRWIGGVGLVLGGLVLLTGVSPMQYLAGVLGQLLLLVVSLGFLLGDRRA